MALPWSMMEKLGVRPERTQTRPLKTYSSTTDATAQTHYIDIPTDHFIHSLEIKCLESVTDVPTTLDDFVSEMRLIGDGSKYIKKMTGTMCKEVDAMNDEVAATGFYKLYFKDPRIGASKPLPSWLFTSLQLEIDDIAPAASEKNYIYVTVTEQFFGGEDISGYRALVEKYSKFAKFGANTGEQEYLHERAYDVFGYLYLMSDNATPSATIFDKLTLKGITKEGEYDLLNAISIPQLKEMNKREHKTVPGTGYFWAAFPPGLPSHQFTSLKSILNIPTAGTNAGIRVLERYLL